MTFPCWICGAPADSREHKIKRSDLVRAFGQNGFREEGGVLHFIGGQLPSKLQGPDSKRIKYPPVLCGTCNSSRSQPWDRAYDTFIGWVFDNERQVAGCRHINLVDVFGEAEVVPSCLCLYKYFVKAFGCRLATAGFDVPAHLVASLAQSDFFTRLHLTFAVNTTVLAHPEALRDLHVLGGLVRLDSRSLGQMERYSFQMHVRWLCIGFYFDVESTLAVGTPWACDSPFISLGEIAGPTLEQLIRDTFDDDAARSSTLEYLRESCGIRIE